MTEYLGRTGSCTAGTKYPDSNLTAYAKEHGFETALLGVVFQGAPGNPRKIYSYWGHTGVKRNHYLKVLVPRGNGQEEVFVKVMSVLPATGIKESSRFTAKHMLKNTGARKITEGTPYLRAAPEELIQRWRNEMCMDLLLIPKTEHAKSAINVIDGMLNGHKAFDFKTSPGYHAIMEHKTQEEVRKMFQCDFHDDQVDALARGNEMHRQLEKQHRLAERFSMGPDSFLKMLDAQRGKPVRFERWDSVHGCWVGPEVRLNNLPRMKAHPPTFRLSDLKTFGPCGRQPKETPMSAKIENVTYVTLPNGARYDAKTLTAQQFFDAIGALEAEVTKLDKISHKPRALRQRIDELTGQIEQLSALCDSLHAAKEEPKADSLGVPYGSADAATTNEA